MARKKANTDTRTQAAENRKLAFDFRKAGWTYAQIGERLGVSHVSAYNYVTETLKQLAEETRESAEEIRDLELARCDMLLKGLEPMATVGNVAAVTAYLKVMERRSKYLGLDAPEKQDVTLHWQDQAIALIRAGELTYPALVAEFGDSLAETLFRDAGVPVIQGGE